MASILTSNNLSTLSKQSCTNIILTLERVLVVIDVVVISVEKDEKAVGE